MSARTRKIYRMKTKIWNKEEKIKRRKKRKMEEGESG